MSRIFITPRPIDPPSLHEELAQAGFAVETVYGDGRIQLANAETKDPSPVIAAHDPARRAKEHANAAQARALRRRAALKAIAALLDKTSPSSWTEADVRYALAQLLELTLTDPEAQP